MDVLIGVVAIGSVVIVIIVHISFGNSSISGCDLLTCFPKTDFRKSNHLVLGNTSWWDIYNNALLDHAPFTSEPIDPHTATRRLEL